MKDLPNYIRRGYTLIEVLVVIAVIAILIALRFPPCRRCVESAANLQCKNNLKNLGLASQSFLSTHSYFPRNTVNRAAQLR